MIKTLTAWTAEADDAQAAVKEIRAMLDVDNALLTHTVGIIACHYEFVHSGVVQAVCEALPFDVVGTISSAQSVAGQADILLLTMMVITSDDTTFTTALTPSLQTEPGSAIAETYKAASAAGAGSPALMLAFAPFMPTNSGDDYINVITQVSGGVPCFGTLAIDDTEDFSNTYMIFNGVHYSDRMGIILLYGNISPKFFVVSISLDKLIDKSAVVTKSAGHVLMEVNERPVTEYFDSLGLTEASETQYALTSLPFMLDYNDGTPMVSKIFIMMTPEGYAICAGAMPEGSTFYIASVDKDDIMLTTESAINQVLQNKAGAAGLLVYSCIGRSMTLGADQFLEMEKLDQKLGGALPYMMAYSGGEICPTLVSESKAVNRFHNDAFIACLF